MKEALYFFLIFGLINKSLENHFFFFLSHLEKSTKENSFIFFFDLLTDNLLKRIRLHPNNKLKEIVVLLVQYNPISFQEEEVRVERGLIFRGK